MKKPLAVDVIAQAVRTNPRTLAAGELAERYIRALNAAGYVIIINRTDPEGGIPGRS
mgnify:CR=1 FL=1|jgi:hypothetical protein